MQDDSQGYLDMVGEVAEELVKPRDSCGDDSGSNIDPMLELSDVTGLHTDYRRTPKAEPAHSDDVTTRFDDIRTHDDDVTAQRSDIQTSTDGVRECNDVSSGMHRDGVSETCCDDVKTSPLLSDDLGRTQDDVSRSHGHTPAPTRPYIEVGVARMERVCEPLQACWSHQEARTSQPSPEGHSAQDSAASAGQIAPLSSQPHAGHVEIEPKSSRKSSFTANSSDPSVDSLNGSSGVKSEGSVGGVTPSTASLKDSSLSGSSESTSGSANPVSSDYQQPTTGGSAVAVAMNGDLDEAAGDPRPRKSVAENVSCCCGTVQGAFLRCQEETPAMVTGVVLAILFCVTIIIIIPSTGRVSNLRYLRHLHHHPPLPLMHGRVMSN